MFAHVILTLLIITFGSERTIIVKDVYLPPYICHYASNVGPL